MEGIYVVGSIYITKKHKKLKLPEFVQQRNDSLFFEFIRWVRPKLTEDTKNYIGLPPDEDLHQESTGQRLTRFYFTM